MKTIPCKTFLIGEYAVLEDGEALGLATRPGFSVTSRQINYHPDSAVALFLNSINHTELTTTAPGGFGRSTAEFISAYMQKNGSFDLEQIIEAYLSLYSAAHRASQRPSGADLVIQCLGQVTHVKENKAQSARLHWAFPEHSFCLVSTGLKINTHEHLQQLDRNKLAGLSLLSAQAVRSFLNKDIFSFFEILQVWKKSLQIRGLTHPQVTDMVDSLSSQLGHKMDQEFIVKPCGALGADVLAVLYKKTQGECVNSILQEKNLSIVATEDDLMDGVLT